MRRSMPILDGALLSDLARKVGATDLLSWIDEEAQSLSRLGWADNVGLRFSRSLLRARRIVALDPLFERSRRISGDAFLEARGDNYGISYVKSRLVEAQRFAIAHEIGHTYWIEPGPEMRPISQLQFVGGPDPTIEAICDRFAACLLLPRLQIQRIFTNKAIDARLELRALELIPEVARRFRVLEKLVARRVFQELYPAAVAVIAIRYVNERWRVDWTVVSDRLRAAESVEGVAVPIRSSRGRVIPSSWIPDLPVGRAQEASLDARWWSTLKPQSIQRVGRRFEYFEAEGARGGFAYRQHSRLLLSLPTQRECPLSTASRSCAIGPPGSS